MRVLLAGESWTTHMVHVKGFDTFTSSEYVEGAGELIDGVRAAGHELDYLPGQEVSTKFPTGVEELRAYDVVIVSDVGANSFLISRETFNHSRPEPNRLGALAEYVESGGGLLMIGGYLSFAGIDGKARYGRSPLAPALPVTLLDRDDRVEMPQGVAPTVVRADHPALAEVPAGDWPSLLGYNQVEPRPGTELLVEVGDDPLLAVATVGSGRSAAFTSDLAPHWAPTEFMRWDGYMPLWLGVLAWLAGER
jgi:uncharacterized membrane protein